MKRVGRRRNDPRKSQRFHTKDFPIQSLMDGTAITAGAVLPDVEPTWHVTATADFNGEIVLPPMVTLTLSNVALFDGLDLQSGIGFLQQRPWASRR